MLTVKTVFAPFTVIPAESNCALGSGIFVPASNTVIAVPAVLAAKPAVAVRFGPAVPVGPVGPVSPIGPAVPVGPSAPVAPVAPVAPYIIGNYKTAHYKGKKIKYWLSHYTGYRP